MNMSIEQLNAEAMSLPSTDCAVLADRLVESLVPAENLDIQELWVAEALKRRDEIRSGLVKTIPGDEALAHVRRAVGQ